MKILQFLFRAGFSLAIAFIISFSSAVIIFGYSGYEKTSDRALLVMVPMLAIAFLLFEVFPKFQIWLVQRQTSALIIFGLIAMLTAVVGLPSVASNIYRLGMIAFAITLFALMLPAIPAAHRMRLTHSMWHYFIGFVLSLLFAYGTISFLNSVLQSRFNLIASSTTLIIVGNVAGYYLVRHAFQSLQNGFLSNPLNIFLVTSVPLFLAVIIYMCLQFPSMFSVYYIQMSTAWFRIFISSAVVAAAWSIPIWEQFETRGYYHSFKQTRLFIFIKENLPGIYAGGFFFLINLILARALNHPDFNINSFVFEADAGQWMSVLGYPEAGAVRRAVHPLTLITLRPLVSLVRLFMADKWYFAPIIVATAMNGLSVFMAWIFVKRATQKKTYAFLIAIILGATASHMLFGSLIETYVFSATALIFFFLLVQADEKRFPVLVPAGLLVFGITVTNIAQGMIALFFKKFGFWRLIYYGVIVLTTSIILTSFASALYPGNQTFFFIPSNLGAENRFIKPIYAGPLERVVERFGVVGRSIFLYGVVAPTPIEGIVRQDTDPIIYFDTYDYQNHVYSWYSGFTYVPMVIWLILLAGAFFSFIKNLRTSIHMHLMLGLLGSLAFTYFLHMNYGTELFLYSLCWTYLVIFFLALAFAELAGRRWFESALTIFALTLMANSTWFIFTILSGLAPYFPAP